MTGRPIDLNMAAVMADFHDGMVHTAIGRKHGCSQQTITRRINAYLASDEYQPPPSHERMPIRWDDPDGPWQSRGACNAYDPETWFDTMSERTAKAICVQECPVRDLCLEEALEGRDRYSVRGGLTARERAQMLTRRARNARMLALERAS